MLVKLVQMISQLIQLNLILKQKHQNNPDMVMSQLMQLKLLKQLQKKADTVKTVDKYGDMKWQGRQVKQVQKKSGTCKGTVAEDEIRREIKWSKLRTNWRLWLKG